MCWSAALNWTPAAGAFGVLRLDLFGSAVSGLSGRDSDLDFRVEFDLSHGVWGYADRSNASSAARATWSSTPRSRTRTFAILWSAAGHRCMQDEVAKYLYDLADRSRHRGD